MEAIRDGRLPADTPQKLSDDHDYWRVARAQAQREAAAARKLADRGVPGASARPPMTRAEAQFLESNRDGLAACTIPTPDAIKRAVVVLRAVADGLESALGILRRIKDERWPLASDGVENHVCDRLDDLLSDGRTGAR
jgi:hypothetical protein